MKSIYILSPNKGYCPAYDCTQAEALDKAIAMLDRQSVKRVYVFHAPNGRAGKYETVAEVTR